MSEYIKKIAVIKQVKAGFSADGGALSGLVKAESYAGFLKVEVSLINFAPITEGRYVFGISDGLNVVTFEGCIYEGESPLNLSFGFAFLVCFCLGGAAPVASASCGQMACALPDLKEEMARRESAKPAKGGGAAYDDEAIAEENYYERSKTDEGGSSLQQDKKPQKEGTAGGKDEVAFGAVTGEEAAKAKLAGGDFYCRMRGEIERVLATYPREQSLERVMEGSRFVRVSYGGNRYYVFGVLSVDGAPRYVCYGVPAHGSDRPPPSLKNISTYLPTEDGGYFITYQDAATGVSVKIGGA